MLQSYICYNCLQTKAAYVLFYQRRDLTNMSNMTVASNSRLCNGQTHSNKYSNMNGTLASDQSPEEDMEVDQNSKWSLFKSSPDQQ